MAPMKIALLFALSLSLGACLKDESITGQVSPAETWHLTALNGTAMTVDITLTFPQKGQIAGSAPCNRYFARQSAPLPWFNLGPIGATRRACPDLGLETLYFETLASMILIERLGNTLLLKSETDASLEYKLR
jgi:heat shock protein HslJ